MNEDLIYQISHEQNWLPASHSNFYPLLLLLAHFLLPVPWGICAISFISTHFFSIMYSLKSSLGLMLLYFNYSQFSLFFFLLQAKSCTVTNKHHEQTWLLLDCRYSYTVVTIFLVIQPKSRKQTRLLSLCHSHCQSIRKPDWLYPQNLSRKLPLLPHLLYYYGWPRSPSSLTWLITTDSHLISLLLPLFNIVHFQYMLKWKSDHYHSYDQNTSMHSHFTQHESPSS